MLETQLHTRVVDSASPAAPQPPQHSWSEVVAQGRKPPTSAAASATAKASLKKATAAADAMQVDTGTKREAGSSHPEAPPAKSAAGSGAATPVDIEAAEPMFQEEFVLTPAEAHSADYTLEQIQDPNHLAILDDICSKVGISIEQWKGLKEGAPQVNPLQQYVKLPAPL
jgi:hypothetical protein